MDNKLKKNIRDSFQDLPALEAREIRNLVSKYGKTINKANDEYQFNFQKYLDSGDVKKMIASLKKSEKQLKEGFSAVKSFISELEKMR